MNPQVHCPPCRSLLAAGFLNQPQLQPCPACATLLQVAVFPALFRRPAPGPAAETIVVEGESSCFYHPQKKAVRPCDGCGRFVCALCDCELNQQHFCPACLEAGRTKSKIKNLDNQRVLYDQIALHLAIFPLLICYLTMVTAPVTLFVAIRYWHAPMGLLRVRKTRFVIAITLAVLEIVGSVIFLSYFFSKK